MKNNQESIDEPILRFYAKIVQRWEKTGRSKYVLSDRLRNISTITGFSSIGQIIPTNLPSSKMNVFYAFLGEYPFQYVDSLRTTREEDECLDIVNGAQTDISIQLKVYRKISKVIRLPFFIAGCSLVGTGAYGVIQNIFGNTETPILQNTAQLSLGVSFLSLASSIYVKDTDPKILDRKPLWKQAYDSLVGPADLQPIKIQSSRTASGYDVSDKCSN